MSETAIELRFGQCDKCPANVQLYGWLDSFLCSNCIVDMWDNGSKLQTPTTAWLPIDSAPKDGRTVLLGYYNTNGKWRTLRGQWMSVEYIVEEWYDYDGTEEATPGWYETSAESEDIPNCWLASPTHWQPLPAPPKEQP